MMTPKIVDSRILACAALALLAACGGQPDRKLDDALQNDLSLAAQSQAYRQQQFVSPQELSGYPYGQPGAYPNGYVPQQLPAGYANGPYYAPTPVAAAPRPVERTRVVYRDRPARSSSGGSGTYSSAGTATQPETRVKKNTKRDAVIGAAAGAAIGVATSARKDRLKGGLLGAVVGAAAGAVIGNNVDKQRVPY